MIIYIKVMREDHDIEDIKLAKDDFYRRHLLVTNFLLRKYLAMALIPMPPAPTK